VKVSCRTGSASGIAEEGGRRAASHASRFAPLRKMQSAFGLLHRPAASEAGWEKMMLTVERS